ncbi:hypothetical protein TWF694_008730 [Orbilia ellipsospora]|uniref:Extracellular serine-rich protein n=1 Tax=Orbilia ellipsospora TaxID=2528407 RepID=A0AAV9XDC3_9PEZI
MFFSKTAVVIASLAACVSAQSSAAPSGTVAVHVVQAMIDTSGKPVFSPNEIQANVGDQIQFQFHPANHSVVQATFADPCIPISQSASGNGAQGFFSGFMPVSASSTEIPTFSITVQDTKPIWFYCSQGKHCQAGMVGAINPTANKTLADFTSRAAQAAANLSPGQNPGTGGTSGGATPTTLQTSAATTGASATNTAIPPPNAGAKLAVSMPLVLAAIAASFFFL